MHGVLLLQAGQILDGMIETRPKLMRQLSHPVCKQSSHVGPQYQS